MCQIATTDAELYVSSLHDIDYQLKTPVSLVTCQLPMKAVHCPLGGYTDRIVCNTSALIVLSHNDRGVLALIVKK